MELGRRALSTAGVVALGCAIFAGSYYGVTAIRQARQSVRYQSGAAVDSGPELVLVFIGSSTCAASRSPDLARLVERLKLSLLQRSRERGRSFAAVGIATDLDPEAGIRFLEKFGRFDEIICGRGWLSLGCRRYLQEIPGVAATPQVVVVTRHVVRGRTGSAILEEHALLRKVGLAELRDWVELGGPLPAFETPTLMNNVSR